MGAVRRVNEARLREAGAVVQLFANADGRLVRVWQVGPLSAATPVVMLHGIGATSDYWTEATLALRKAGRTVLLPDFPGSGGSEEPATPAGYGLPARVATVESLAQALGLDTVDLVGHSLGGWTAGLYALEHPRRIGRLVLVDPGGFTRPEPEDIDALKDSLSPRDRPGGRRLLDLLFFRLPFPPVGFVADALARNYRAPNVMTTLDAIHESDGLLGREAELPRGTVLIWGEKEILFPLADARRTAARLREGRLLVITGVGHDGPLEAPAEFHRALLGALGNGKGMP